MPPSGSIPQRLFAAAPLLLILSVLSAERVAESAWTQEQGRCYAKVWARTLVGSGAFDTEGDAVSDVANYLDISAQLYAECGIHPHVTALVSGTFFGYASVEDSSAIYLGPISAGLRVNPLRTTGSTRFALQATYSFAPPVGDEVLFEDEDAEPRVFYQAALQNHYGEFQMLLGHGFSVSDNVSGWFSGGMGVRINSASSITPAFVASAQLGFSFYNRFVVEVHLPVYQPFGAELVETNIAGVGQTRYVGYGLGLSYWFIEAFALTAAVEGAFLARSNAATPALIFGIESRFRVWSDE